MRDEIGSVIATRHQQRECTTVQCIAGWLSHLQLHSGARGSVGFEPHSLWPVLSRRELSSRPRLVPVARASVECRYGTPTRAARTH